MLFKVTSAVCLPAAGKFLTFMDYDAGSLPPELGKLTTLSVITVRANQLTGSLPPELGNLNKLIFLGLSENPFSGSSQDWLASA